MAGEQYGSWKAFSAAYKAVARNDQRATADAHLRFAVFDRFLCRVFADQERSEWLLKGGTGLLARVPDSRATKDVDLVTTEKELDEAQEALIEVAQRDLGDHVEFHFKSSQPTGGGENQPNVQARQVTFACSDADNGRWIGDVKVDLAVEQAPVGTVDISHPRNRLNLPKELPSHPYRLFPVADQIADKVWATLQHYSSGRASTREKDLVDLLVISQTQEVHLDELRLALETERVIRGESPVTTFRVPDTWGVRFSKLARETPACSEITDVEDAVACVRRLIEPALSTAAEHTGQIWRPGHGWSPTETCETGETEHG